MPMTDLLTVLLATVIFLITFWGFRFFLKTYEKNSKYGKSAWGYKLARSGYYTFIFSFLVYAAIMALIWLITLT